VTVMLMTMITLQYTPTNFWVTRKNIFMPLKEKIIYLWYFVQEVFVLNLLTMIDS